MPINWLGWPASDLLWSRQFYRHILLNRKQARLSSGRKSQRCSLSSRPEQILVRLSMGPWAKLSTWRTEFPAATDHMDFSWSLRKGSTRLYTSYS